MSQGRAPSAPLPPGPPPAQRRVSPPGSKALLEAPGPEARLPGSSAQGGARSRFSPPGCFSGFSVVAPSPAEQDPKEQQDRGREAHPEEILHRVVWVEGALVSAGPVTRNRGVRPGHPFLGEDVAPEPSP